MATSRLGRLSNVSERDQRMIQDIETMLGPEPSQMGFIKNMFWGRSRNDLVFPYPTESREERAKCDRLLTELEAYLRDEHPAIEIDHEEYIPDWVFKRLFDMGVMGLTIPEEYGGLGLGVTSYNRVLEAIGKHCASTAVVVSAHQSIGCKAIMLFGTEEQKSRYLPVVAREKLSAFCLSEPNAGSDAAGQETYCVKTDDGDFVINGEKKWSTSGSISALFTVMAKQKVVDPKTGEEKEGVSALICSPDMEGVEIFEQNRSKAGIRGTWQARIRLTNVRVPKENLLHREGKGLVVALSCLNYGRCTLSAGVGGAAKGAMDQSIKWVQTRYQFGRPLADFELVQQKIARMAAYTYAMDAVLYMMTGMLDRGDADIMVETAATKVFCSHFGWEVIDDAMQIMGGEGYMTENELERTWRDNRIHRIVEGSNEVMESFIFAYGGKQLAESMISVQEAVGLQREESIGANLSRILSNGVNPSVLKRAVPLAAELFLGKLPPAPRVEGVQASLSLYAARISQMIRVHSRHFKLVTKKHREEIIKRQAIQARLADNAIMIFALTASVSRMDRQIRDRESGPAFERDRAALRHLFDLLEVKIDQNIGELTKNADSSM
ncbi:MAG: acyl-CoA dehydrogenase family protein, partial [Rhodothermales bacterium]